MTINAWQEDADGKFFDMLVGAIKDYGVDVASFLDSGDSLAAGVWAIDPGVTASNPTVAGTLCRVVLQAVTAGVINGKLTFSTVGGLTEIVPFRVIVK